MKIISKDSPIILLVNPPMDIDSPPKYVSFGIIYITMELKRHGYNVELLDIDANRFSKEEVRERIKLADPDIVGIGGLTPIYPYLHWLVPEIKKMKPGIEIILGGAIASSLKERCFERFDIDYEVIGEGEITIIELMKEIETTRNFASVRGIAFRENGEICFTEKQPLMPSLDNVPIIDYNLVPMDKLIIASNGVLQIHTQRGCPFHCTFCYNNFRVVANKVRYRPLKNVLDEIELLNNNYDVKMFAITGECVAMNKEWLISFCKEIIRRNLNIRYRITSRVDTIDEERLEWLKKSGCVVVSFGLESGSKKILSIMKKGLNIEQSKKAIAMTKKYIDIIEASIILGYIGDDENTLKETLQFCKDIKVKPLFFHATPFPGTELYKMALQKGSIPDEEAYLNQLDKSSILKPFQLNLTDMTKERAEKEIKSVIRQINRYYYYREIINFTNIKKVVINIKENGIMDTITKIKAKYLIYH